MTSREILDHDIVGEVVQFASTATAERPSQPR